MVVCIRCARHQQCGTCIALVCITRTRRQSLRIRGSCPAQNRYWGESDKLKWQVQLDSPVLKITQ
jgi:hypothetical protein